LKDLRDFFSLIITGVAREWTIAHESKFYCRSIFLDADNSQQLLAHTKIVPLVNWTLLKTSWVHHF
jgi:hypothetical protein